MHTCAHNKKKIFHAQERASARARAHAHNDINPYAQLELIAPVRAGQQLFADYGPNYAYNTHGFARFSGAGPVLDTSMLTPAQLAQQRARHDADVAGHKAYVGFMSKAFPHFYHPTGGGVLDDINPFHKTTYADEIDRERAIRNHPYSLRRLL